VPRLLVGRLSQIAARVRPREIAHARRMRQIVGHGPDAGEQWNEMRVRGIRDQLGLKPHARFTKQPPLTL